MEWEQKPFATDRRDTPWRALVQRDGCVGQNYGSGQVW